MPVKHHPSIQDLYLQALKKLQLIPSSPLGGHCVFRRPSNTLNNQFKASRSRNQQVSQIRYRRSKLSIMSWQLAPISQLLVGRLQHSICGKSVPMGPSGIFKYRSLT